MADDRILSKQEKVVFLETVWEYFHAHGRHDLPWRRAESDGTFDPYKILVSELMLQQTQAARVIPKFSAFIQRFPTVTSLASASLGDVLRAWQGLGYNRRAKYLWLAAQAIVQSGNFPATINGLIALPGVGINTAGAVLAYAFSEQVLFIETNIRTVYIHHFFFERERVPDAEIRAVLAQTLPGVTEKSLNREFYWALMDYGSWLKTQTRNTQQSTHYVRQSSFNGSRRQVRGQVIRELSAQAMRPQELAAAVVDERLEAILKELLDEGLIVKKRTRYSLYK